MKFLKKINFFYLIIFIFSVVSTALLAVDYYEKHKDILYSLTGDNIPAGVFTSDVEPDSAVINWYTTKRTSAYVKVTDSKGDEINTFFDDKPAYYHRVKLIGLPNNALLKAAIFSNGDMYNIGEQGTFRTAKTQGASISFPVYGQVFDKNGIGFIKDGIISLMLDNGEESQIYSAVINEAGGYQFNLGDLKEKTLAKSFDLNKPGTAKMTIHIAHKGDTTVSVPYDFSKSRQFLNLITGDKSIEQLPGINETK